MKSSSSYSIVSSSIPDIYPSYIEWRAFKNKISSILLSLLALSTILILFILHSSNPFSMINNFENLNKIHPTFVNCTTATKNSSIPDKSSTITMLPTSLDSTEIQDKQIQNQLENTTISSAPENEKQKKIFVDQPGSVSENKTATKGNTSIANTAIYKLTPAPLENTTISNVVDSKCDLFVGKWVRDEKGSIYTNTTCRTLPDVRNCGKYGKNQDYVFWRWKPDGCELPRFDPWNFLRIVRGKKLMFIGDSLARNMMESTLCLLSQAEVPVDTYKDKKDKHRTWYFPTHDFSLMVIWTEFLVDGYEIINNGTPSNTFSINLDKMHPVWAQKLPELSYAVINNGNWFTRRTYIHKAGKLIGCVHCLQQENITSISVASALRMVFKAAFRYIIKCKECGNLLAIMRTYSMSHFEHGSWFSGGYCNRTQPSNENEASLRGEPWDFRRIQLEEFARAKKLKKKRFELMDVTKAMILRADAHPGRHWIAKQTSDCLHWCLPGPIDMWSELLLEILKRRGT